MAFAVADSVWESSTDSGSTASYNMLGVLVGYKTFFSTIGTGNTCYYAIVNRRVTTEWEIGLGTISGTSGTGILTRTTILSSSTGSLVNFSAGVKDIFCTYPASTSVYLDEFGNLALDASNDFIVGTSNLPQIKPSLNLDFANGKQLDPRITFARNTVATYTDKYGLLVSAASNVARFDYDPITRKSLGLLVEELRTNNLLNSTIDGVSLVTQSITTTAVARTLSFYGTGTVVLSGTATGTIVGLGAYPKRTTYTYTPTAGTLTLTVSGTVQYANDEAGSFATSYIPTAGTVLTRAADQASMQGTNFSSWYNQSQGTVYVDSDTFASGTSVKGVLEFSNTTVNNQTIRISYLNGSNASYCTAFLPTEIGTFRPLAPPNNPYKITLSYSSGNIATFSINGINTAASSGSAGAITAPIDVLVIGKLNYSGAQLCGHIRKISYYPKALTSVELQGLTS